MENKLQSVKALIYSHVDKNIIAYMPSIPPSWKLAQHIIADIRWSQGINSGEHLMDEGRYV